MVMQQTENALMPTVNRLESVHVKLGQAGAGSGPLFGGLALLAAALSMVLFQRAVKTPDLPLVLIWALLAAASGAVGLYLVGRLVNRYVVDGPGEQGDPGKNGRIPTELVFMAVALMIFGAGLALFAFLVGGPILAPLGMLVFAVGAMVTNRHLRITPLRGRNVAVLGGLALVVGCFLGLAGLVKVPALLLAVGLFAGLVLFKVGLPQVLDYDSQSEQWTTITVVLGVALATVGLVMATFGADEQRRALLVAGLMLFVMALSAAAPAARRLPSRSAPLWFGVVFFGIIAAVFGGFQSVQGLGEWLTLKAVLIVTIFAIGAWFVLRGETLFALVLLAFVSLWVLVDRTVPAPEVGAQDETRVLVALGDSYMAGQGGHEFYERTNSKDDESGNSCRRSPDTYATRTADLLGMTVINWACSGALIQHLIEPQSNSDPQGSARYTPQAQLFAQNDLDQAVRDRIDVVLVSFGGNDAFFSTVVVSCLLPSDCSQRGNDFFLKEIDPVEDRLANGYKEIARAFPNAEVVVVPYPQLLDEDRECGLAISEDERTFVFAFQKRLDEVIDNAALEAASAGHNVVAFPGSWEAFVESERLLCDNPPGLNFVHLMPHDGTPGQLLNPGNWKDGSLHPREEGHAAIAEPLADFLRGRLADKEEVDAGPGLTIDDLDEATRSSIGAQERLDMSLTSQQDANVAELYNTVRAVLWPLAFLFIGGLLVALGLANGWLRFGKLLAPLPPDSRKGKEEVDQ